VRLIIGALAIFAVIQWLMWPRKGDVLR